MDLREGLDRAGVLPSGRGRGSRGVRHLGLQPANRLRHIHQCPVRLYVGPLRGEATLGRFRGIII